MHFFPERKQSISDNFDIYWVVKQACNIPPYLVTCLRHEISLDFEYKHRTFLEHYFCKIYKKEVIRLIVSMSKLIMELKPYQTKVILYTNLPMCSIAKHIKTAFVIPCSSTGISWGVKRYANHQLNSSCHNGYLI